MRKIIIAGASGFIGRSLIEKVLPLGYEVVAIVPDPETLKHIKNKQLSVIKVELEDFYKLSDIVSKDDYSEFYYLTWKGYGKDTNNYVVQTENIKPVSDAVIEASKLGCKRFIFASSFSEYMILEGETKTHSTGASANVYGSVKHASRLVAHAVSKNVGIDFLSVAFANTFGPGDYSRRSPNFMINKLIKKENLDLTEGKHLYDWNYIDDTIEGLILAGEKGKVDELYYIGNYYRLPLKELIRTVRDIVSPNSKINLGKYQESFHLDYTSIDTSKLYRDTGYLAKTDFQTAIINTMTWVDSIKDHLN